MRKKIVATLSVLAIGLLATTVPEHSLFAQESQAEQQGQSEERSAEQKQSEQEGAKNRDEGAQAEAEQSERNAQSEDDSASARQKSLEGFTPSEEISGDLSVSFPVDI